MESGSRRALLMGAVGAGTAIAVASCTGSSTTGGNVGQQAGSVNDLTVQLGTLSVDMWNQVSDPKINPGSAYPITLLKNSLELRQQRERLLRNNVDTKQGWLYLFGNNGNLIMELQIQGKVSSTESSMTSDVGMYTQGSNGEGNTPVPLPGDDGSFGPNEGGVFWFDQHGVMGMWNGLWMYFDAPLDIPAAVRQTVLSMTPGAKPSSTAPGSDLF